MKNNQKGFASASVILIVLLVIGGGIYYYKQNNASKVTKSEPLPETSFEKENKEVPTEIVKNDEPKTNGVCGFSVKTVSPNSEVSFPLTIKGVVDRSNFKALGCAWQTFEGTAGIAQLYYNFENQGWKPIGNESQIFVDNWATTTTPFTSTVNFNNEGIGLPKGTKLKVVFIEENVAATRPSFTFELPLILK